MTRQPNAKWLEAASNWLETRFDERAERRSAERRSLREQLGLVLEETRLFRQDLRELAILTTQLSDDIEGLRAEAKSERE